VEKRAGMEGIKRVRRGEREIRKERTGPKQNLFHWAHRAHAYFKMNFDKTIEQQNLDCIIHN
jgi:hypothetical protein